MTFLYLSMEIIGMYVDKLIMIFAGIYISFIWPSKITKSVRDGELDKKELSKIRWLRPVGIILILISIVLLFVKL